MEPPPPPPHSEVVDVVTPTPEPFGGPVWDTAGMAPAMNLDLPGERGGVAAPHAHAHAHAHALPRLPDDGHHQGPEEAEGPGPGGEEASGMGVDPATLQALSQQLLSCLQQSRDLAESIRGGNVEKTIEIAVAAAKPVLMRAAKTASNAPATTNTTPCGGGVHGMEGPQGLVGPNLHHPAHMSHHHHHHPLHHHHHHSSTSAAIPLPLAQFHNFPDVPDVDGLTMDPFGVDLMLNKELAGAPPPPPSMEPGGPAATNEVSNSVYMANYHNTYTNNNNNNNNNNLNHNHNHPEKKAPSTPEEIQQAVLSEVNRLKGNLLQMEQRMASAYCMQKSWNGQRMPWRIKVKKARNFNELLLRLKEIRKSMVPLARLLHQELDQLLGRLSPTSINGQKLSRCLEDFRNCIAKSFPDLQGVSLSYAPHNPTSEFAKIASAVEDTRVNGLESFTRLPLGDVFAKHPDVTASLKRLLQKQKIEVVAKLAELSSNGGGGARGEGPISQRLALQEDESATDMSDSD